MGFQSIYEINFSCIDENLYIYLETSVAVAVKVM